MPKDFVNTILRRRSIRRYTADHVAEDDIKVMLEAAMAAPSASNRRPWHFIVVTDRRTLDALGTAHPYGKMLLKAPLGISVCGNKVTSPRFWIQDCSAATENLLLAATALDLGAVWLGVYPRENRVRVVREILKIPDHVEPLNLISIGRPGEKKEPRTQYDHLRVHQQHW